jgi:hypothetical protein
VIGVAIVPCSGRVVSIYRINHMLIFLSFFFKECGFFVVCLEECIVEEVYSVS